MNQRQCNADDDDDDGLSALIHITTVYLTHFVKIKIKISAFTPLATHTATGDGALFCWHDIQRVF